MPMSASVWINGERQDSPEGHVSARDRGLTLGDGVFETMRARGGTVFRLDRHLTRLAHALDVLEIPPPPALRDWVLAAVPRDGDAADLNASLRLTVTRGVGPAGVLPPADARPTVIVTAGPMPAFPASIYDNGLAVHVASGRRNQRAMTAGLKTVGYVDAIAALLEARRAGADEALFLDTDGHCSEATSSNLFIVHAGVLVTPPVSCGALPGITRATVIELAAALSLIVVERAFDLKELREADEAFLTSSLRGIAPMVTVDAHPIGDGRPGPATRRVADAYAGLVDRECRGEQ